MILYDPFNPVFPAAARIAGVAHAALIPHSGPGIMSDLETSDHLSKSQGVRSWLLEAHGVDLFDNKEAKEPIFFRNIVIV
ncbi:hypothetical protein TrRE_jg12878 [Triparma retinervis]|uniref:Uncharacterized protein n=1 Tax=Triparma retinervis TaxID=2557542 RepID=A0A9W7FES5_9STRA|nr:hypothetical protein TrRE_jg12878 [Triparma retinervis]